jgi:guanine nucleotide-binding protein subunit beta-2-like 1 protein
MNVTNATVEYLGALEGHNGLVTSIVVGNANKNQDDEDAILVSGSRDKTLIIWKLDPRSQDSTCGKPWKTLTGHNHFVSDLTLSNDNMFVISSSWDKTLRLWDLRSGKCVRQFHGHNKEVHTVSFSTENRQIFSGGSDKAMNLWNTLAECKMTSNLNPNQNNDHKDWVSRIRFSQSLKNQYWASVGWDGRLKLWTGLFKLVASIKAHESNINALDISRNGIFIATGGKDQVVRMWDYHDLKKPYMECKCESVINALTFNTNYQWLAGATDTGVKIWDIANENACIAQIQMSDNDDDSSNRKAPRCTSLSWSANGTRIYVGCDDGVIRLFNVSVRNN